MFLKGDVGEELFVSVFVIILVFVFIFSTIGVYSKFIEGQTLLYAERTASSLAEKIYFDYAGQMDEQSCKQIANLYNFESVAISIVYWKGDTKYVCKSGKIEDTHTQVVSSMPILITSGGKFYPGRIDVLVKV